MPPCPRQAPRPPLAEVVPSLQVTGPLEELEEEEPELLEVEEPEVEAPAELAAGALLEEPLAALADLSTPPWPLQAPRPACVAVVPSLQTGAGVELSVDCDSEIVGLNSRDAVSAAPNVRCLRCICSSPLRGTAYFGLAEYRNMLRGGITAAAV
jgi:hypothetical protein